MYFTDANATHVCPFCLFPPHVTGSIQDMQKKIVQKTLEEKLLTILVHRVSCRLLSFCLFIGLLLSCIVIQGSEAQYRIWSKFRSTPTIALLFSNRSYFNRLGLFPEAVHTSSASVALLYILDIRTLGQNCFLSSVHLSCFVALNLNNPCFNGHS